MSPTAPSPPRRRVVLALGTRPEAVKLAPLAHELARRDDRFETQIWLTAQHREQLDPILKDFDLHAERDFDLMRPGQTLTDVTVGVLRAMETALAETRPDCLVVQGDTTTVLAAALAAFYARVEVAHVEAGLRTGLKHSPWPEEMNRQLATRLADFHFAPTERARRNLLDEGVDPERVWVTGNTVIDALAWMIERVRARPPEMPEGWPGERMDADAPLVLMTGHRRENFGAGLKAICRAVAQLAERFEATQFVYPVHLNPNVREPVRTTLGGRPNVHLIEPMAYRCFVAAMDRADVILSDSGGVQEEATWLGKPILVMRETTERPEAVEAGAARLVGADEEAIVRETARLLDDPAARADMARAHDVFGDGHAAQHIADILEGVS